MSCRTTPAGSAWTTFARLQSDLTDVQTLSTFHALRREGRDSSAPTAEEWNVFVNNEVAAMEEAGFSEARTRSIRNRMDRAGEQVPDGPTWHAVRNIRRRTQSQSESLRTTLTGLAERLDLTEAQVTSRYHEYMGGIDRSRSATAPEGYTEARNRYTAMGVPVDPGTYAALTRLTQEAAQADATNRGVRPNRVEHRHFPGSRAIQSAGYDPHDGRLEVVFRRRNRSTGEQEGVSRTYAYRGVPASVWEQMNDPAGDGVGVVYNQQIRNHDEYRYESREAEDAAASRRCGACGQWYAPGHVCPTPAPGEPVSTVPPVGRSRTPEEEAATNVEILRILDEYRETQQAAAPHVVSETSDGRARLVSAMPGAWDKSFGTISHDDADLDGADLAYTHAADGTPTSEPCPGIDDCPHCQAVVEPAPEPDPEPDPGPEVPARPEPVSPRSVGLVGRSQYARRSLPWNNEGRQDWATFTPVADTRREAGLRPLALAVHYSGYRSASGAASNGDGLPSGSFTVSGTLVFDRPARGEYVFEERSLQCTCPEYRANYRCPHIAFAVEAYRNRLVPTRSAGGGSAVNIEAAQQAAEAALAQDFMRQENEAEQARAAHAAVPAEDNYSATFAAFEADHDAALARNAAGEPVVPLMESNALGGEFTRESGRGFGVELEFDFPNNMDYSAKRQALAAIGQELYDLGLTSTDYQQHYHAAARRGYSDNHARGWSFEQDCTVAGEIVSPVMYDEPETWDNINKVCEIVRRHGGVANAKTGSHVHVSAPNMTPKTATELMRMTNQYEDVLYRMSQNPERPSHRPMQWCGPNREVPVGGYSDIGTARASHSSHNYGMNLQGVTGATSDHPEVRYWDGTLDPALIQTQVKMSAGLILAAERNAETGQPRRKEPVGSHQTRLAAVRGRSRRNLTAEELREDTATVRSFLDTVFTRREDKAQSAALFAVTKWQRNNRR